MFRIGRWIVAVMLMLCLPLQGMAAIALPIGMVQNADVAMSTQAMDEMSDHCMQHEQESAQPEKSASACDKCFSCHISVAQALAPFSTDIQPTIPAAILVSSDGRHKVSLLTFSFFRPPISA